MNLLLRILVYNNLKSVTKTYSRSSYRNKFTDAKMEGSNYRGVPISEIRGSENIYGSPEFPMIPVDKYDHAVLFIPSDNQGRPPQPRLGPDMWDNDFVRLPCSRQNKNTLYVNGSGQWRWDVIKQALSKPIRNVQELIDTIRSYNTKYERIWKFSTLRELFNEEYSVLTEDEIKGFFTKTLPDIAQLALKLPELIKAPIPLLKQNQNMSISMSQEQISTLLANAFFCTFPYRNSTAHNSEYASYPHINFSSLFEARGDDVIEKLKCIIHYFQRVCRRTPVGVITFTRRSVSPKECPNWADCDIPLSTVKIHVDPHGAIERSDGLIQLDFANKYLGGGVLNHGSVQEEIRFVICPELMVSMLFTEMLLSNEAVIMLGAERYSKYIGYSRSFQFMGDYNDPTTFDSSIRRRVAVLAIDALPFSSKKQEYKTDNVVRELNKAWVGFSLYCDPHSKNTEFPGVATGNWGCGAFGGSPQLKALLQLMACAVARRPMAYLTFGDEKFRDDFYNMYQDLTRRGVTVGQLYRYILTFAREDSQLRELFSFLHNILKNSRGRERYKRKADPSPATEPSKKNHHLTETPPPANNSPDFFSQDEDETNLQESQVITLQRQNTNSTFNQSLTESDVEMAILQTEYDESDKPDKPEDMVLDGATEVINTVDTNKCAFDMKTNKNETDKAQNTTRLFEEMDKIDGDSNLNLSVSHRNFLSESPKVTSNEIEKNATPKKKNRSNKITSYFTKETK